MINLQVILHTPEEIQRYIERSLDIGNLKYDMMYVESMLKYVHSPLYKQENPRHTKEDTQILVSKFTRIFRGMLSVKEKMLENKLHCHFTSIGQNNITNRYTYNGIP